MRYYLLQRLFFIIIALLLVTSSLFLLADSEQAVRPEPIEPRRITPFFITAGEEAGSPNTELVIYPQSPAPGDFIIIEAGPMPDAEQVKLDFDFQGAISKQYLLGEMIYTVAAISYENEPDSYNLELINSSDQGEIIVAKADITIAEKDFHFSSFSMPASRTAGWTAERLAEDREKVRLAREATEQYPIWDKTFINPVEGRISSTYGAIRVINQNPPRRHAGIDIAADEGTPIYATNRGIVRLSEYLLSGGETIIIDHGLGLSSTYMHLHTLAVEEGEIVERGQEIGTVGMTGYATGPHLHWEVNIGQTPVNPEQLFDADLLLIPPAYVQDRLEAWQ